jgi:hypothetical protein
MKENLPDVLTTSDRPASSQDLNPLDYLLGNTSCENSAAWMLTKREENQVLVFERKVLRTTCGLKIENGVYRRRYNHELDKKFNSLNALNVTKTSRLRYAGHMIRRPEDLPQKALFRAKLNGRKNQGRLKYRWTNGVNSDSLALRVRNWTYCAQFRQTWRYLLQQALTRYSL